MNSWGARHDDRRLGYLSTQEPLAMPPIPSDGTGTIENADSVRYCNDHSHQSPSHDRNEDPEYPTKPRGELEQHRQTSEHLEGGTDSPIALQIPLHRALGDAHIRCHRGGELSRSGSEGRGGISGGKRPARARARRVRPNFTRTSDHDGRSMDSRGFPGTQRCRGGGETTRRRTRQRVGSINSTP